MSSETAPGGEQSRSLFTPQIKQFLLRLLIPGWPQFAILTIIARGALRALGYDTDQVLVGALLAMLIFTIVSWINVAADTWQQSVRDSLALAAVGAAVWLTASVVRGSLT